jgi:hypothetical protein
MRQKALPTRHEVARPLSLLGVSLFFWLAKLSLAREYQRIPNRLKQNPTGLTIFFGKETSASESRLCRIEVPVRGLKTTKPSATTPG